MKQISSLFDKYKKNLRPPQASVVGEAVKVIAEVTKFPIREDQVTYTVHSRVLSLHTPSVLRTEIVKQKERILTELQYRLGKKYGPKDIR